MTKTGGGHEFERKLGGTGGVGSVGREKDRYDINIKLMYKALQKI